MILPIKKLREWFGKLTTSKFMVKLIEKDNPEGVRKNGPYGAGKKLYQCEECGFHYEDREWAPVRE